MPQWTVRLGTAAATLLSLMSSSSSIVQANDGVSLDAMDSSLQADNGRSIALLAHPLWHIGAECGNWPCYPDWATRGSLASDDLTMTPPAERTIWPHFDSSWGGGVGKCAPPGQSNPFPTYFTVTKCESSAGQPAEYRATYSIFFAKDGVSGGAFGKDFGHDFDWEDATVIWRRDSKDSLYYRDEILLERHGPRVPVNWAAITSTFNNDTDMDQDQEKKRNHPKLYIGTSKHAIFHIRKRDNERGVCTFFADINAIQNDDINDAVRGDNWRYMASADTLVDAANNTAYGRNLQEFGYGGLSVPGNLQKTVCDLGTRNARNGPADPGNR